MKATRFFACLSGLAFPYLLAAQIPTAAPLPYQDEVVTAAIPYDGVAGQALVRSFLQPPGARRGIFLLLGGYDPHPVTPCQVGAAGFAPRTTEDLEWRVGFDIHEVRWCVGDDYIQRNAFIAVGLIERYQSQLRPGDKFVLEGASMGGLVARYALDYMESRGIPHGVNLFLSYDSPQMGAYVPVGVQFASRFFRDFSSFTSSHGIGGQFLSLLSSLDGLLGQVDHPAPRQMLITYYGNGLPAPANGVPGSLQPLSVSQGPSPDRQQLLRELTDMGDYPKAPGLRAVAIADGAGWGVQRPAPAPASSPVRRGQPDSLQFTSSPALGFNKVYSAPLKVLGRTLWTFSLRVKVEPQMTIRVDPLTATGEQTVFHADLKYTVSLNSLTLDLASLADSARLLVLVRSAFGIPPWVPDVFLIHALDPIRNDISAFVYFPSTVEHRAVAPVPYDLASGSLDTNGAYLLRRQLQKFGSVTGGDYEDLFIPTTSALGLDLPPGTDLTTMPGLTSPRFQQIYYSTLDYEHLEQTPQIQSWFCQEEHRAAGLSYISSIEPASRESLDGGFSLTVHGANFTPPTQVYLAGQPRQTTYVDSAEPVAAVLSSDVPYLPPSGPVVPPPALVPVALVADPAQPGPTGCPANLAVQPNPITIQPAAPTSADDASALFAGEWSDTCVPSTTTVSRSGYIFTINGTVPTQLGVPCKLLVTPYTLRADFGSLPAGSYQVIVTATPRAGPVTQLATNSFTVQRAPPLVSAISPASLPAGSPEATVTVDGDQFVQGQSIVLWNGFALPTQFVSANQLQASLSAADLAIAGTDQISVSTAGSAAPGISAPAAFAVAPGIPQLTGLSVTSAVQNSPGLTLTLNGANFAASSVAYWDDTSLVTRFLSSGSLQAEVPASLLTTPGSFSITVVSGALATAPQLFTVERAGGNGPGISAAVNGASFVPGVSRGAVASLIGSGFSTGTGQALSLPLPDTLVGVEVLVGDIAAPLYYVSPDQINFQVPFETPLGSNSVQVVVNGVAGPPSPIDVADYALGVFQYQSAPGVFSPNLTDTNFRLISDANPARPGEDIVVWATGIGALDNPPPTDAPAPLSPLAEALEVPDAVVAGSSATVPP